MPKTLMAEGKYVVVIGRVKRQRRRVLQLHLVIVEGSLTGRPVVVRLYIPEPGNPLAGWHFRRKVAGLGDLGEPFKNMAFVDPDGSNVAGALEVLAEALIGRITVAELTVGPPSDRPSGHRGMVNELISTEPVALVGKVHLGVNSTTSGANGR
jgi:hypothetical protein